MMIIVLIVSVMKLELNIQLVVGEVEPLGELPHGEVLPGGVPLGEQEVPLGEVEPLRICNYWRRWWNHWGC